MSAGRSTSSPEPSSEGEVTRLADSVRRAQVWLSARQKADGHWVGELEGDSILETEYVLLLHFLGRPDPVIVRRLCAYVLDHWQDADGGIPIYPGGPADISASVKAYFACKLAGLDASDARLRKLRQRIVEMGGVTRCNTFTKLYLAVFGQYDWDGVPTIPPELCLLPPWFYLNVYEMSSWSRAILIPLAVINAGRPSREVPPGAGIDELYVGPRRGRATRLRRDSRVVSWRNVFLTLDRMLKLYSACPIKPGRRLALERALRWMREHQEGTAGLGAIFPAMTHAVMAYVCSGMQVDDAPVRHELDALRDLMVDDDRGLHLQPCLSPVWDTAIAINALVASGIAPDDTTLCRARSWLEDRQVRTPGDWSLKAPHAEPGGWSFEYANPLYPDVDDTAMVLMALTRRGDSADHPARSEVVQRGVDWMFAMQCRDGGWASFDRDNTRMLFQFVPYADHNAMLDPPSADITARAVEALCEAGVSPSDARIQRAITFVRRRQESDGSWFGRWGVNYVYGTWQAIRGLTRAGVPSHDPAIAAGVRWLQERQNDDGGWGESCASYDPHCRAQRAASTASQTAWGVLGLIGGGAARSMACRRAVEFLLRTQTPEGTWNEAAFTGTGFPRVFYLRYHLYAHYFPLWALGEFRRAIEQGVGGSA